MFFLQFSVIDCFYDFCWVTKCNLWLLFHAGRIASGEAVVMAVFSLHIRNSRRLSVCLSCGYKDLKRAVTNPLAKRVGATTRNNNKKDFPFQFRRCSRHGDGTQSFLFFPRSFVVIAHSGWIPTSIHLVICWFIAS